MTKTIEEMTREILQTFKKYEKTGTNKWNYKIATMDLSYQIGSLTKRIMQSDNDRFRENLSNEELKEKIADELVDIIADTLLIAHDFNIDIDQAWQRMHESDTKKITERSAKKDEEGA